MERPDEVTLSRQDSEALIERLHRDALTAQDRRVLEQVLRWYFWLLFGVPGAIAGKCTVRCPDRLS
jgi:hypothetical protein